MRAKHWSGIITRRSKKFAYIYWISLIRTLRHDGVEHAGYIAFLTMLAVFPFLIFFTLFASFFANLYLTEYLDRNLANVLTEMILNSSWSHFIAILQPRIIEITHTPPNSFLTFAIFSTVWTSSSIFEALRRSLNKAYEIPKPPAYLWRRFLSIIQFIIVVTFLVITTLFLKLWPVLTETLTRISDQSNIFYFPSHLHPSIFIAWAGRNIGNVSIMGIVLYLYCTLPNIELSIKSTIPGTISTLVGWSVFANLFSYYIKVFSQINLIYGSIASVIICLLYFYICSLIFIYGGEVNAFIAKSKPQ